MIFRFNNQYRKKKISYPLLLQTREIFNTFRARSHTLINIKLNKVFIKISILNYPKFFKKYLKIDKKLKKEKCMTYIIMIRIKSQLNSL